MKSIVMIGATGAVGTETVRSLVESAQVNQLTLLGRRSFESVASPVINQKEIDIFDTDSYRDRLSGHDIAICTLGVGQPSKISKEDFIRIDKQAVLDFATECNFAGIKHFLLLSSVGANHESRSFYLRTKGELQEALKALSFEQSSLFQPSMIITDENRYGFTQGLLLKIWPILSLALIGPLKKYRGIHVTRLGKAIALQALHEGDGVEILQWPDFNHRIS